MSSDDAEMSMPVEAQHSRERAGAAISTTLRVCVANNRDLNREYTSDKEIQRLGEQTEVLSRTWSKSKK